MAKFGFGIGYITPVIIISVGQLLLGNTLAAVTELATAATLTNPIAMTCAAVGAIYYGWSALSEAERNEILVKLQDGLNVGIELIKAMVAYVTQQLDEFRKSKNFEEFKNYIGSAAKLFGKTLGEVTHKTKDRLLKFVDVFDSGEDEAVAGDPLIQRLHELDVDDLKTIITGGLRIDPEAVSALQKGELVLLFSRELRAAAGSTMLSKFRGDHELPYKQILIDVADKLSPGHTPLAWTKYRIDDSHSPSEIEDEIARIFEDLARTWWEKLSQADKEKFVDGINGLMSESSSVKDILGSGVEKLVKQSAVDNIIQLGVMHGLSKVAAGGLFGTLGLSLVTQIGWAILLQTVGWIGGVKIAVFGIAGQGALGGAVTAVGSFGVGLVLSIPGLVWLADSPAYRKTIPTIIMLIAKRKTLLLQNTSGTSTDTGT